MNSRKENSFEKKTCILIVGMHRSGTSALTGVMEILGADLGSNKMPGDCYNEKGYFENNHLVPINENILHANNTSWDDTFVNQDTVSILMKDKNICAVKEVITKEFASSELFAIKDPRLCYLFPVYEKVLRDLEVEIKIILPYRNPVEVALSLNKRDGMSFEKGIVLWANHFFLAEQNTRNYSRIFVNFDDLIHDTQGTIEGISSTLGVGILHAYQKYFENIKSFLSSDFKRFNVSFEGAHDIIPKMIFELYSLRSKFNTSSIAFDFTRLGEEFFANQKYFYHKEIAGPLSQYCQKQEELIKTIQLCEFDKNQLIRAEESLILSRNEHSATKDSLLSCQAKLAETEESLLSCQVKLDEIEESLVISRNEHMVAKDSLVKCQAKLSATNAAFFLNQSALDKTKKSLYMSNKKIKEIEQELFSREKLAEQFKFQLNQTVEVNLQLNRNIKALQDQVISISNSKFWKITTHLRNLKSFLFEKIYK